jgi:hypothetical protein
VVSVEWHRSHSLSHSVLLSAGLTPIHATAAALAVAFEFAPQSFGDAQIGSTPETIHLTGEVGSDLRGADHQQHLVVLMGGRGAPVEAAGDDGAVVDDSELVVDILEMCLSAWFLRDAHAPQATC